MIALWLVACGWLDGFGTFDTATVRDAVEDYAPGRCHAETQLKWREPAPEPAEGGSLAPGVEARSYDGPDGPLKGWFLAPEGVQGKAPALVFLHGGFALSHQQLRHVRFLVQRGWVVYLPAYRGESNNPGTYELLCGEVDDAAAAVRWVATQPEVDPARVTVFGHSAGGATAAMLALHPDLPVAMTGSAGGLYFEELMTGWGPMLPFDPTDEVELHRRLMLAHADELVRPHHAWLGRDDVLAVVAEPARAQAARHGTPLTVTLVDGDHHSSVDAALKAFVAQTGW